MRHGKQVPKTRRPSLRPVRTRAGEQERRQAAVAQRLAQQPTLAFQEADGHATQLSSPPAKEAVAGPATPAPGEMEVVFELKAQLDATGKDNLETIQDLLRHRLPHGNLNDILSLILQEAADRLRTKKGCTLRRSAPQAADQPQAQDPSPALKKAPSPPVPVLVAAPRKASSPPVPVPVAAPRKAPSPPVPVPLAAPRKASSPPVPMPVAASRKAPSPPKPAPAPPPTFSLRRVSREDGKPRRRSRNIPSAVRRAVYRRDGGRCTWKQPDGRSCGERAFLEYNHRRPFALGGGHTVENVELLCRAHNQHAAVNVFGEATMAKLRSGGGKACKPSFRKTPSR